MTTQRRHDDVWAAGDRVELCSDEAPQGRIVRDDYFECEVRWDDGISSMVPYTELRRPRAKRISGRIEKVVI